jgi:subtilisin family serine protease
MFLASVIAFSIVGCMDREPVTDSATATNAQGLTASAKSYVILATGAALPADLADEIASAGGTVTSELPQVGIAVATSNDPGFAAAAAEIGGVRSVFDDLEVQWIDPVEIDNAMELVGNPPTSGDDDTFFDLQWGHDAVDAPEAWATGARGAGARVAILDSGIDSTHPDLAPNLNVALSTSFVPGESFDVRPGAYFNHGSHVAGTVAAADNAVGGIGVAPEAEIVAVKVLSEFTGRGAFSWILQGIVYAADIDADIINMSLSGQFRISTFGNLAAELLVAFNRTTMYAQQQGTLVIAAAGNFSIDRDHDADFLTLPADAAGVVAVSATAPEGWGADPSTDLDVPASYRTSVGHESTLQVQVAISTCRAMTLAP